MSDKAELIEQSQSEGQIIPIQTEITPMQLLSNAMDKGVDIVQIEKLMDLQERHESNKAKQDYVKAMTNFARECPRLRKDKNVKYQTSKGITEYNHTSLGFAINSIMPILGKFGLSYNWKSQQDKGLITVHCYVTHISGHSEYTSMSGSADATGGKNAIQAIASTTTYLQRYTLFSLLGLASSDDDDGQGASDNNNDENNYISQEQANIINNLVKELVENKGEFLNWIRNKHQATCVEKLPQSQFETIVQVLERKRANNPPRTPAHSISSEQEVSY